MKKHFLILICFSLAFFACEDAEPEIYNDAHIASFSNGTNGTYAVADVANTSFDITVGTTNQSSSNRTIAVSIDPSSTITSDQYTLGNLTIPANSNIGTVTVFGIFDAVNSGDVLKLNLESVQEANIAIFDNQFTLTFIKLCPPPVGTYTIEMHDSYGDGWQTNDGNGGSGITVNIDGNIVEFGMCSPYGNSNVGTFLGSDDCTGPASTNFFDATANITVPEGAESADWYFPGDNYGEISFEIYGPDGTLYFESGEPGETGEGFIVLQTGC